MNARRAIANAAILVVSLVVALALCELGARLVLNPADYLSVTMKPDQVLGMAIAPQGSGLDAWGFRNPGVPASADIVALGDSHTFGNTATMDDAWPSVLARQTGRTVYNLGLGGYGPNQYYHLLKTRGLSLRPRWILCGLYMGDDFENAFSITYGLNHWAYMRSGNWGTVNANIWDESERPGAFKPLRDWLSRKSLVYQLVAHGGPFGALKEAWRFRQAERGQYPSVTAIRVPDQNILEAFRPLGMANRLDQSRPEVKEGMRITFRLLMEMDRVCRESGCTFVVVVIPTKETVFAKYFDTAPRLHLRHVLDKVIGNERLARLALLAFLRDSNIAYVDTLPALSEAVGRELYARTTADMHPGKNGYRVIGEAVARFLGPVGRRD